MNPLVKEWIQKAEGDFVTASREFRVRSHPNYDAVCFHCQQSLEKYMKAILQLHNIRFTRTHQLEVLLDLALPLYPLWEPWRNDLELISSYAVDVRYPGEGANQEETRKCIAKSRIFRKEFLGILDLAG